MFNVKYVVLRVKYLLRYTGLGDKSYAEESITCVSEFVMANGHTDYDALVLEQRVGK